MKRFAVSNCVRASGLSARTLTRLRLAFAREMTSRIRRSTSPSVPGGVVWSVGGFGGSSVTFGGGAAGGSTLGGSGFGGGGASTGGAGSRGGGGRTGCRAGSSTSGNGGRGG